MPNPLDYRYAPSRTYRYWCYTPDECGMRFFRRAADRDAAVALTLELYREEGEWPEEVDAICAGEVTLMATQIDRVERPATLDIDAYGCDADGMPWPDGCEYRCRYALRPLAPPETAGEDPAAHGEHDALP
jgi:hypothetical protein